ncbi:MAG: hypothetical protein OXI63_26085 [Candidatus Poribacteria bacterium]|nr:hypothetical protein [Candidatus Poribacteria bacterium]
MIRDFSNFRNKNLAVHDRRYDTHEILIHCLVNASRALKHPKEKARLQDPDIGWHERPQFSSHSQHLFKLTTNSILGVSPYRIMHLTQLKLHPVRRHLEWHTRK